MFSRMNQVALVYKSVYSGNKSSFVLQDFQPIGFLAPISNEKTVQAEGAYNQQYEFVFPGEYSIDLSSRLVIGGITYMVRGKANYTNGSIKYQRLVLEESQEV